jgi:hypothetical protein
MPKAAPKRKRLDPNQDFDMRNMGMQLQKPLGCLPMFFVFTLSCLAACGGRAPAATAFQLPTAIADPAPVGFSTASIPTSTTTPSCTNNLLFLQDLTIPDDTEVAPGSSLDKQWQVQNNGTCNWDGRYRLRLVSGDALGAPVEQALFPARSASQIVIRITFTAPGSNGTETTYTSEWQAYDPQGYAFGDSFFIRIKVSP